MNKVNIKKITIVGGGSAGWMTASALIKHLPDDTTVTLIESPRIGTIGVGESTIGHINTYMDAMGLKDSDWMSECNATYKTSIKFTNFREKGSTFHYPFGKYDFSLTPDGLNDYWRWKAVDDKVTEYDFAKLFHSTIKMIDDNKFTDNEFNELHGFNFKYDTAYHMDATLFGQYLKRRFCDDSSKMTHILDEVVDIVQNEDNSIKKLITKESGELEADLFIDCTGFASVLLDKTLKVPFIKFDDVLLNDRAVATQIPYIDKDKEMESVTNCTAIENGWVWNIPLFTRIGTGYVYSSKHATEEEAEEQFRRHLKSSDMVIADEQRADDAEVFHLKIRHGIHKYAWSHNVVGIGLASGFIEPLESTGLMLAHENILFLLRTLLRRNGIINRIDVDSFNFAVRDTMEGFRQFISLHYALSSRSDTPYWEEITKNISYDKAVYEFTSEGAPLGNNVYADLAYSLNMSNSIGNNVGGTSYILAGMGFDLVTPVDLITMKERLNINTDYSYLREEFDKKQDRLGQLVDLMPTHYEWLKENIHTDKVKTGEINNGK
jgi:tryptophan halogenase